jgi:hypothetical protein
VKVSSRISSNFFLVTHADSSVEQKVMELRADHRYEEEMYWSHQLFYKGWVPTKLLVLDTELFQDMSWKR